MPMTMKDGDARPGITYKYYWDRMSLGPPGAVRPAAGDERRPVAAGDVSDRPEQYPPYSFRSACARRSDTPTQLTPSVGPS